MEPPRVTPESRPNGVAATLEEQPAMLKPKGGSCRPKREVLGLSLVNK